MLAGERAPLIINALREEREAAAAEGKHLEGGGTDEDQREIWILDTPVRMFVCACNCLYVHVHVLSSMRGLHCNFPRIVIGLVSDHNITRRFAAMRFP